MPRKRTTANIASELRVVLNVLATVEIELETRRNRIPILKAALGMLLREMRQAHNVSLRALARKLKLSASFVSDVELGRRNINAPLLAWLRSKADA